MANNYLFVNSNTVQSYVGGSSGATYSNVTNTVFVGNVSVTNTLNSANIQSQYINCETIDTLSLNCVSTTSSLLYANVLTINSSQYAPFSVFRARQTNIQTIPITNSATGFTNTKINFDYADYNPDSNFDTINNTFLGTLPGYYYFSVQILNTSTPTVGVSGANWEAMLYLNGVAHAILGRHYARVSTVTITQNATTKDITAVTPTWTYPAGTLHGSAIVYMNGSTDVASVYVTGDPGSVATVNLTTAPLRCRFEGFFLRP